MEARNLNESVIAVIPGIMEKAEHELEKTVSSVQLSAEAIVITNDDEYQQAAAFGRNLKQKMADVKDFFKPIKDAANQAHKAACDRERQMLDPLTKAESTLKLTMGAFLREQEIKRKAQEEEQRRKAEEEAKKKLDEAIAAGEAGDQEKAQDLFTEAVVSESASRGPALFIPMPKAQGVSSGKDWEVVSVNDKEVPLEVAGIPIRPVDMAAVMRLIRSSKGTIRIPGVTYKEIPKISIGR
jgi:hypothetical protein